MKNFVVRFLLVIVVPLFSVLGFSQNYPGDPGTAANPSVKGVDLVTLNVSVPVPIVAKNGFLPFSTSLTFNNNFWYTVSGGGVGWQHTSTMGWLPTDGLQFGRWNSATAHDCGVNSDGTRSRRYMGYLDSNGIDHILPSDGVQTGVVIGTGTNNASGCSPYQTRTLLIPDGAGLTATLSASGTNTIKTPGGVTITPQLPTGSVLPLEIDANGNTVSEATIGTITDSVNVQELVMGGSQTCPIPYHTFTYPTSTGTATVTVNCVSTTIQTDFGCTGVREFPPVTTSLVDNIVLGDGSTYRFDYESQVAGTVTGRVASITYPDGSVRSYTYTGPCGPDGAPVPTILTLTDAEGTYTFTRALAPPYTTTVVSPSPAGNKTVYTFIKQTADPKATFLSQVSKYQGASTLLETDLFCYNGNQVNCATATAPTLPITRVDGYSTPTGMSSKRHTVLRDSYGNTTEEDTYDYGASTPSIKMLASSFGYTWNGSTSSPTCTANIGNGIMDRSCLVRIQTGSGSTLRTSYRQFSTTGHTLKTGVLVGSSYITTSATYNANGSIASVTDLNGQLTTITEGACNGVFPTVVTPALSALAARTSWDCSGAVVTSATDPNGFSVNTAHADPFWRVTSVEDQAGVYTNTTYLSPTEAESILSFNGGNSVLDTVSKEFPLSNSSETQTLEGPTSSNWDTVVSDFVWDSTGIKTETQMPCVATTQGGGCSAAKSTVTHDALGRPLVKTDGGSGTLTYSYIMGSNKYDVLAVLGPAPAGEVTRQVQKEYNGLGQLLSVCNLGATGGTSCGQVNGGTGILTTFSYYLDGTVASVVRGSQTHSYTYDNIGRTLTSTMPESGITYSFYDSAPSTPGVDCSTLSLPTNYSPIGHLLKTYDTRGNTACYSYDQMGRSTGIAYAGPDFDGANKYFVYDSATVNGVGMVSALGRIAQAYTAATYGAGTKITDEGFSYNARGQKSDVYQWSTHSGGWYHISATYFDNDSVNTLAGVPGGQSPWTFGLDGKGRAKTASTSTADLVSNTTYNVANQPCLITLGNGDKDTYMYDGNPCSGSIVTGRMSSYDFSLGATPTHLTGTLTWNANGTLRGLTVVDGINAGADSEVCDYGTSGNAG